MPQLIDVVAVKVIGPTSLWISFSDGTSASVDLRDRLAWTGLFATLRAEPSAFAAATVDRERCVVCWPNGADIDSDQLYAWAQGLAQPEWLAGEKLLSRDVLGQ